MKNLFFLLIALLFILPSCNKNENENEISEDPYVLPDHFYGFWVERDDYNILRIKNSSPSWWQWYNVTYYIGKDGNYSLEYDTEFGLPAGTGTWSYDADFECLTFIPSPGIEYDTSLHFYWKIRELKEHSLVVDYYRSKTEINEVGEIRSNRIPRRFY